MSESQLLLQQEANLPYVTHICRSSLLPRQARWKSLQPSGEFNKEFNLNSCVVPFVTVSRKGMMMEGFKIKDTYSLSALIKTGL